jgi:hypothetical protein
MRRLLTAALLIVLPAAPTLAQEALPKFYVYGEADDPAELRTCRVSHASAIVAVQAELRGKGIVIQTDSKDPEAVMDAYVNINAMPISTTSQSCAYNFELAFESYAEIANPFSATKEFTKLSYCSKGSLMVWDKSAAQAEINRKLREYVGLCIDRYNGRNSR